jgi:hypothetical protein
MSIFDILLSISAMIAFTLALHVLICRYSFFKEKSPQSMLFWIIVTSNFFYLVTFFICFDENILYLIYFLLTYNLYIYSYFHLFNMSETAQRIKILSLILDNKISNLNLVYNTDTIIYNRLARLVKLNWINFNTLNSSYVVKNRLILGIAIFFNLISNYFNRVREK